LKEEQENEKLLEEKRARDRVRREAKEAKDKRKK